MDLQASSRLIN